jgi:hypothetical protein
MDSPLFLRGGLCNRWILAGQIFSLCIKKWSILMNEDKVEGKAMCYEIRELIGKKTRESNSIQRTGSPEMSEHPKIETMLRAWLKKRVPKGSARDKKERPVEAV